METRANYALVGFFTFLVMLSAFGFVYWMARYGGTGETAALVVRIPGSANGLSVGSPVRFNGIPYGVVRRLDIDPANPAFVIAQTEVRADSPIYTDTRATLEIEGLTGGAFIELNGGTPGNDNIIQTALSQDATAIIEADPSGVTNLLATADEILRRTNRVVGEVEGFINDARAPLTETLRNAETFSLALKDNAEGIDEFLKSISGLSQTVTNVSTRLDSTLQGVEGLINAVDPQQVSQIVDDVQTVTGKVAASSDDITDALASIREAADNIETASASAETSLARIDEILAAVDTRQPGIIVDDLASAAGDARSALAEVRQLAETVGSRRDDIDGMISDAKSMMEQLNQASGRIDGVLAKADSFLGEGDASSLIADAQATLKSIQAAADNLNGRIGPIADNLQRFSGSGLRDVQALVNDARRSITRIERSISGLEQNPQRLLFGGDTVKQYDGRTRR